MLTILKKLRSHATYANIVASLALFIALGGISYAAVKLPANSVATKHIKKNAVTLDKVSPSARESLKGQTGPAGPQGPQGTAGANGTNGAPGEKGDQGDVGPTGPSNANNVYTVGNDTNETGRAKVEWSGPGAGGASQTVISQTLAAGSYAVFANALVVNGSTTEPVAALCSIVRPGKTYPPTTVQLAPTSPPAAVGDTETIPLATTLTLGSEGDVSVVCSVFAANAAFIEVRPTLTIIKVGEESSTTFTP